MREVDGQIKRCRQNRDWSEGGARGTLSTMTTKFWEGKGTTSHPYFVKGRKDRDRRREEEVKRKEEEGRGGR
jgi:hypothetical protein